MSLLTSGRFLPYNPALKDRARYLRSNPTKAEKKLWYEFLRKLTFMVYRQRPINNFIVDFYLPIHKLIIEVDGILTMKIMQFNTINKELIFCKVTN
jgi:very-short-patch-repair endonuclease